MRNHGRNRKVELEDAGGQYKFIFGRTEFRVLVTFGNSVGSEMRNKDGDSDLLLNRYVQL